VNEALLHLIDVQRIDGKVDTLNKQRTTTSQKLVSLKKRRDEVASQLTQLDAQLGDRDRESRNLNSNLALDSAKAKKWEARLNEIRNQREFLALSREVEGQKKQNTEAQERIANLGTESKDLTGKAEAFRDELAETEIDIETEQALVDSKMKELDVELQGFETEKKEFLSQVPAPILKRYDLIRSKRGVALAPVANGRCLACNMLFAPQLYNTVVRGDTIETCPACNRFVYYRPETPEQPVA